MFDWWEEEEGSDSVNPGKMYALPKGNFEIMIDLVEMFTTTTKNTVQLHNRDQIIIFRNWSSTN